MTAPTLTPSDRSPSTALKVANIAVKLGLVLLIVVALADPDLGGVKAKAGGSRALAYPLAMLLVPAIWWAFYRVKSFPWLGDLLLCLPWFTDTLGNRLNLYDTLSWFDDWMHFMNTGLLAAAFILLTLPRDVGFGRVLERALAFGATSAIAWEVAEYFAFISRSTEREFAYADTLGDLSLGTAGAVLAAVVLHRAWRHGYLVHPRPLTSEGRPAAAATA